MDMSTILALASILACIVGVATFIVGMTTRAKNDGKIIGKVEYICTKVDEMSADIKANEKLRIQNDLENAKQAEQIKTLFTSRDELQNKIQTLEGRMNTYERSQIDRNPK